MRPTPPTPATERPARREARAVAAAIDLIAAALIAAVCAAVALIAMLLQTNPLDRDPTPGEWAVGYAIFFLFIPLTALYAAIGSALGGGLGPRLLGLRIDATWPRAVARGLLWWPGALCLAVAVWWPWIDPLGRAPVDRITGTWLLEPATQPPPEPSA